jgi:CSLREA domain-containing protein
MRFQATFFAFLLPVIAFLALLTTVRSMSAAVYPSIVLEPFVVNSTTDATDANPGDGICETAPGNGICTLRAAIQETNALTGTNTIILPAGIYTLTIPGQNEIAGATGDLNINDSALHIVGAGSANTIVDVGGLDRVFGIRDSIVEISGITIRGGSLPSGPGQGGGGILTLHSSLILDNVVVTDNHPTDGSGGGIASIWGNLIIQNSTVSDNSRGAIYNSVGPITITNSLFEGNSITSLNLGVVALGTNYNSTVRDTVFRNNQGATIVQASPGQNRTAIFDNIQVVDNDGLGMQLTSWGHITVSNSLVAGNQGGGISMSSVQIAIIATTAKDNENTGFAASSYAQVTIVDSHSFGNGRGISNNDGATMRIDRSSVHGNHNSGIRNGNHMTITNSAIHNNMGSTGAGIYNSRRMTLINSSVSGNTTTPFGSGGGVYNSSWPATVSILNSSIVGNSSMNGGGIFNAGSGIVAVKNTLLADNVFDNCGGIITSEGHNLESGDSCGLDAVGDLPYTLPLVRPIADNGGPTLTHALLPGSPAIDAADDTVCPTVDQRGEPRPVDGNDDGVPRCDIGAYEYAPAEETEIPIGRTFYVNSVIDAVNASPGDGLCETVPGNGICTLRAAVQEANALAGRHAIIVPGGVYSLTLAGSSEDAAASGDLDLTGSMTIIGAGPEHTFIDGNQLDRVFHLLGADVEIIGVTIRNGRTNFNGSGIYVNMESQLTLRNSRVQNNFTIWYGGSGIDNAGILYIEDSAITDNMGYDAGGILNRGQTWIYNSAITNNAGVPGIGGGLYNKADALTGGYLTVVNSTISHNRSGSGGGIANSGVVTISHSTLVTNTVFYEVGGAIFNIGSGVVNLGSSILANNDETTCNQPVNSLGYNIDSGASCLVGGAPGDQSEVDALIMPLQNNGGPTLTHALQVGSPAIDAGVNANCPDNDQRGATRPVDGNGDGEEICDIGSYEFGAVMPIPGLSIRDVTTVLQSATARTATFAVTLTAPASVTVTVNYETADHTALAGVNYLATSGTLQFAPGVQMQIIQVTILGNATDEPLLFFVNLNEPVNATITHAQGVGTIIGNIEYDYDYTLYLPIVLRP